ncbi:MAG: hypothetical protein Q8Q07_00780 [Dehalococcoidales bacterium]|nr:hypothetical protein [Dehalococcoidales bacterium]
MARILKQDAHRMLGSVPGDNVFRCSDGRILASMAELKDALDSMSDETFAFHVNATKNDFSNWVGDIIRDEKLARDLNKAAGKLQAARSVAKRLAFLQDKLSQPV